VKVLGGALVGLGLGKIIVGLVSFGAGIIKAAQAVRAFTAAQALMNITMLANPIFLVTAAIGAAVAAYLIFRDTARSASDAQNDLNAVLEDSQQILDDYKTALDEANEAEVALGETKLRNKLVDLQAELEQTAIDLEDVTDEIADTVRGFQFATQFQTGGIFGDPDALRGFRDILQEVRTEFSEGRGDIETSIARLQEFSQSGQEGAEQAARLAEELAEMRESFVTASDGSARTKEEIEKLENALNGIFAATDEAAAGLDALGDAADTVSPALLSARDALAAFEEKARVSGLSAADKAREIIQAETDALLAQLEEAGATAEEIARAVTAGATQQANVPGAPGGGGASAAEREAEKQAQTLRSLQDQFDLTGRAAREFADIEMQLAELTAANVGTEEQRIALLEAATAARDAALDPLSTILGALDAEINLVKLSNDERTIQNQLLQVEQELRAQGITLGEGERTVLEGRLRLLQETGDAFQEGARLTEEMKTPTEAFNEELERLNELLGMEAISIETFGRASDAAAERLQAATEKVSAASVSVADEAARQSFRAFSDFLFKPFEGGLKGMLSGFADTLRQMASNQLAEQLFSSLSGIGGGGGGFLGAIGSFFGAGIADNGGRGTAGQPVLIGTGAQPEAFIPDSAGTFVPQQQMGAMGGANVSVAAPTVNVAAPQVVVVDNADKAEALLQSSKGEEAVLSILRNNPGAARGAIGA